MILNKKRFPLEPGIFIYSHRENREYCVSYKEPVKLKLFPVFFQIISQCHPEARPKASKPLSMFR